MNTVLRHWKEAATLILAAEHRLGADTLLSVRSRNSQLPPCSSFNYRVLMLKRSGRSGFMPNAYVFPGGMLDSSDFSSDWLGIFKTVGKSPSFGLRGVKQPMETRPPIFATDRLKLGSSIPGEVALRICALRETFEESGVLLVVPKPEGGGGVINPPEDISVCDPQLCSTELSKWRTLVNQNPSNFIRMCRELEVMPNIWALQEWGNWLTPEDRYGKSRFDTAFFICCLKEIPHTLQDEREIQHFQWSTPTDVLQSYQARELWIAPPQFYELSRLCRFPLLNDLHSFSCQRATEGCEQWMPVLLPNGEHYISLLPGDKLYPSDSSAKSESDENAEPHLKEESALHRVLLSDPYTMTLQVTITPKYKHLLPVMESTSPKDSKSQL
ncbi:acyl-coenzyme A diphosphatase NUDT19 [Gouania willdenowi]|uniref:Acyl-coenzyme A diphosphatase NUDT19 n=1 Tax=Gouania willdenowi TaxID=441366 RepID=A0A8C5EII7_GOUWI|nr:nucleoside diphosphate-linked moiety X motif 19 [Gouania willdenowi]